MTKYSKYNVVYRLQKWMDSVPGQTFLNYAYSWGASIVVLGALFKLTHLQGADIMLFIGMGTEVFVFFISAFDRPFDKSTDGMELPTHITNDDGNIEQVDGDALSAAAASINAVASSLGNGPRVVGATATQTASGKQQTATTAEGNVATAVNTVAATAAQGMTFVQGQDVTSQLPSQDGAEALNEAQENYVTALNTLTETIKKVQEQCEHLTRDSEEMQNLNRTLTGISTIYEMQLKGVSQQVGTIDQINDRTRRMAEQIEQLNSIYARMIEAMTVNMRAQTPGTAS